MKYLIASDIHGSLPALDKILDFYDREAFDQLILLGDLLNYGPRNGLPDGLNAPAIVERLNERADQIVCVRGNCDAEVDQMLLRFDLLGTYAILVDSAADGTPPPRRYFLTHGHKYNAQHLPAGRYDAIFYGHTHLQGFEEVDGQLLVNTGSPTFPKGGNPPTFVTLADGRIRIHHLDGAILQEVLPPPPSLSQD